MADGRNRDERSVDIVLALGAGVACLLVLLVAGWAIAAALGGVGHGTADAGRWLAIGCAIAVTLRLVLPSRSRRP